jgi:hypothetical protein
MILIDFAPYSNKNARAFTMEADLVYNMHRWLTDNCGEHGIGWEWKTIGNYRKLLSGVYLQNPEDVLAFKLKFGI